jgi:hypothetical protein
MFKSAAMTQRKATVLAATKATTVSALRREFMRTLCYRAFQPRSSAIHARKS